MVRAVSVGLIVFFVAVHFTDHNAAADLRRYNEIVALAIGALGVVGLALDRYAGDRWWGDAAAWAGLAALAYVVLFPCGDPYSCWF